MEAVVINDHVPRIDIAAHTPAVSLLIYQTCAHRPLLCRSCTSSLGGLQDGDDSLCMYLVVLVRPLDTAQVVPVS